MSSQTNPQINLVPDRGAHLRARLNKARPQQQNPAQSASIPSIVDTAMAIFSYLTQKPPAVPPSEDMMYMNDRQLREYLRRNQPSASSSSGPMPPHPPIYPPAQPHVPTGVPVIALNSSSEAQMTPDEVDQVQRDIFGDSFSSAFSGRPRRDPSQQDEAFPRIITAVPAQPPVIEVIRPRFIPHQP
ncbi:MAG: hypothetical protein ACKPKO_53730, partial [Candidatus Fonsibacter sp.]